MQIVASQRFKNSLAKNNCRLSNFHCLLPNIHCQLKNFSYLCGVNPPPTISLSIPAYVPWGVISIYTPPAQGDDVVSNHPISETR